MDAPIPSYSVAITPGDDPGVWVAYVPALDLATEGDSFEHAAAMASDAIQLYVEGLRADGLPLPADIAPSFPQAV